MSQTWWHPSSQRCGQLPAAQGGHQRLGSVLVRSGTGCLLCVVGEGGGPADRAQPRAVVPALQPALEAAVAGPGPHEVDTDPGLRHHGEQPGSLARLVGGDPDRDVACAVLLVVPGMAIGTAEMEEVDSSLSRHRTLPQLWVFRAWVTARRSRRAWVRVAACAHSSSAIAARKRASSSSVNELRTLDS